jgi:hypothetical protein
VRGALECVEWWVSMVICVVSYTFASTDCFFGGSGSFLRAHNMIKSWRDYFLSLQQISGKRSMIFIEDLFSLASNAPYEHEVYS